MINKDQLWSFMAIFAPKLPVLSNVGEMPQIWNWVTHFDEDCQTCLNMANSGILWAAMLTYGPLWLETSSLANSITVSAFSRTSVTACYIWRFGAFWDKIGGMWPEDATNGPICLTRAWYDQFWNNLPHCGQFGPRLEWYVRFCYTWHDMLT
jgi:hypothetical protein